jgi:hypothetical protein
MTKASYSFIKNERKIMVTFLIIVIWLIFGVSGMWFTHISSGSELTYGNLYIFFLLSFAGPLVWAMPIAELIYGKRFLKIRDKMWDKEVKWPEQFKFWFN